MKNGDHSTPMDEVTREPLRRLVFVDTDIGDDIDDALALALLLCSPEVEVVGVSTVFGDTTLRARLAAHLLQVFGHPEVPVAAGQSMPLQFRHRPSGVCQAALLKADQTYSLSSLSGPELLVQTARTYPGLLTLLCLGPLTNVALALQQEPALGSLVQQVFVMGGSSRMYWPDWNVRSDARAAQHVLAAHFPLTMVGLNITSHWHLRAADVERLNAAGDTRLHLLAQLIAAWQRDQPLWRSKLPGLHDPLTATAFCMPQFFRFAPLAMHILTRGPLSGWTIPRWLAGPTVRTALAVEGVQARAWMLQRWFSEV